MVTRFWIPVFEPGQPVFDCMFQRVLYVFVTFVYVCSSPCFWSLPEPCWTFSHGLRRWAARICSTRRFITIALVVMRCIQSSPFIAIAHASPVNCSCGHRISIMVATVANHPINHSTPSTKSHRSPIARHESHALRAAWRIPRMNCVSHIVHRAFTAHFPSISTVVHAFS